MPVFQALERHWLCLLCKARSLRLGSCLPELCRIYFVKLYNILRKYASVLPVSLSRMTFCQSLLVRMTQTGTTLLRLLGCPSDYLAGRREVSYFDCLLVKSYLFHTLIGRIVFASPSLTLFWLVILIWGHCLTVVTIPCRRNPLPRLCPPQPMFARKSHKLPATTAWLCH